MTDELPQFPDPMQDPRIVELQARIDRAIAGVRALNSVRRDEDPAYDVDSNVTLVARVEALASILVGQGTIDYIEFTGEHMIREAEQLEKALAAFTDDKRRRTGLIVPPSSNGQG